jgi:hypothetical protein
MARTAVRNVDAGIGANVLQEQQREHRIAGP